MRTVSVRRVAATRPVETVGKRARIARSRPTARREQRARGCARRGIVCSRRLANARLAAATARARASLALRIARAARRAMRARIARLRVGSASGRGAPRGATRALAVPKHAPRVAVTRGLASKVSRASSAVDPEPIAATAWRSARSARISNASTIRTRGRCAIRTTASVGAATLRVFAAAASRPRSVVPAGGTASTARRRGTRASRACARRPTERSSVRSLATGAAT